MLMAQIIVKSDDNVVSSSSLSSGEYHADAKGGALRFGWWWLRGCFLEEDQVDRSAGEIWEQVANIFVVVHAAAFLAINKDVRNCKGKEYGGRMGGWVGEKTVCCWLGSHLKTEGTFQHIGYEELIV